MQPYDPSPFMYCFYPHPWAFEVKNHGDFMITWSETCEGTIHGMAERITELENGSSISEDGGAANISRKIIP